MLVTLPPFKIFFSTLACFPFAALIVQNVGTNMFSHFKSKIILSIYLVVVFIHQTTVLLNHTIMDM